MNMFLYKMYEFTVIKKIYLLQVIPNVLGALYKAIGLRGILLGAAICMIITIPIAIFLRTITVEQLALLEKQLKQAQAPPPPPKEANEEAQNKEEIELVDHTNKDGEKTDPDAITPEPVVVDEEKNGSTDADKKKEGLNDMGAQEKLLAPAPNTPQTNSGPAAPAVVEVKKKKGNSLIAAFAYFKHMPPLFKNPTFLIHATHFAVMFCVEMIFMSVTFDSFLKVRVPRPLSQFCSRDAKRYTRTCTVAAV